MHGLLDSSRKVFVNENCYQDKEITSHIITALEKMGFSKDNITRGVNLDLMRNGDYKIRCIGGDVMVFQIEFYKENVILKPITKL
mgnify:CR=1 FL=1